MGFNDDIVRFFLLFKYFRILLFTAIMTPYRIAFYDIDTLEWIIVDTVIDLFFGIDLVLNFFMAYYNE